MERGTITRNYTEKDWAVHLADKIKNNKTWQAESEKWLSTLDIKDTEGTAISWWKDAHDLVCTVVMPNGLQKLKDAPNLYPGYYREVIDVLELQVAKGGRTLATWLDAIALSVD